MHPVFRVSTVALVLLLVAGQSSAQQRQKSKESKEKRKLAGEFKLDHFMIYQVANIKVDLPVALQGQFDEEPRKATLKRIAFFANPVDKNGEGILDKNAHLTWYGGDLVRDEPDRVVVFRNQFGEQTWRIKADASGSDNVHLLVPTEKQEKGSAFPQQLDHFRWYKRRELGKSLDKPVTLQDQFRKPREFTVKEPVGFGVPVMKTFKGQTAKINNHVDHLAFYYVTEEDLQRDVKLKNQFGQRGLVIEKTVMLAVPSKKLSWKVVEKD